MPVAVAAVYDRRVRVACQPNPAVISRSPAVADRRYSAGCCSGGLWPPCV